MLTARVVRVLHLIGWSLDTIERRGLTTERRPIDHHAGYFCTASGCLEDRTDSYGECINCGEPVIQVWDALTPSNRSSIP